MLNLLGTRLQKAMAKMNAKTILTAENILEVTREIKMALLEADVNLLVVKSFIKSVKAKALGAEIVGKLNPGQQMIKIVREELIDILGSKVKEMSLKADLEVIMMVGLQGSGKTTTTAKLVNWFKRKKKVDKPLMIAADIYRPAAVEQLKVLGKQLGVDVFEMGVTEKPETIVKKGLIKARSEGYDLVLIDTAGRLSIDQTLMNELKEVKKIAKPQEILMIIDALSGQDIINVTKTFDDLLTLSGTIITKLDSDARGGAALSIRKILKIPIRFIGTGEKLNSLDLFYPDRMADRILGMGDVLSIIEKAEEVIDEKKAKKMANRMMAGHFDLDDLLQQMQQIAKLGKLSKIIKMLPGVNSIPKERIIKAEEKQKLFEILISSMTLQERKSPKLLKNAKRKARILKGSGRKAQEYNSLINDFERMAKQMKAITKQMKDGTFNPNMLGGSGRF